jgi:hypothetical protein
LLGRLKSILSPRREIPPLQAPDDGVPYHERRYAEGVKNFEAGQLDLALAAFSEFLQLTHQTALIGHDAPFGLAEVRSYADFEPRFRGFLDERSAGWAAAREPFPRFLKFFDGKESQAVPPAGKRILFAIPQYIMNSQRFIEADFKDHLLDSAANAGAVVDAFYTDRCSYPGMNFDSASARDELRALQGKLSVFRPDVVLIDGNYVPSGESLNPVLLHELKKQYGFRLIAFIGDAWGAHWAPAADAWSEVSDIIFHFAPDTPLETLCKSPGKLCWGPYPVNESSFFQDPVKRLEVSFIGTYVSALRPFWLTVALQVCNNLGLKHQLLPHRREAGVGLTMADYATVLRQSRMVLNFSTRLGPLKVMTGRAWQAVAAGTVLLDEQNTFTSAYFAPFVHFVPFSTRDELAYAIEFFSRNPNYATRLGDAAHAFWRKHYSSPATWSYLLGAAYRMSALESVGH